MADEGSPASTAESGLSRQAQLMRQRRQDPSLRKREIDAEASHDSASKTLIDNHKDEFLTLLNEERFKRDLPPFRPRGKSTTKRVPQPKASPSTQADITKAEQEKCPHNQGLKKMPYGIFCGLCNKRIR